MVKGMGRTRCVSRWMVSIADSTVVVDTDLLRLSEENYHGEAGRVTSSRIETWACFSGLHPEKPKYCWV